MWPEFRPIVFWNNEWTGRDLNPLNHVLRTGSQVKYEKTINEVVGQKFFSARSRLSYGAMEFFTSVGRVGIEPTLLIEEQPFYRHAPHRAD